MQDLLRCKMTDKKEQNMEANKKTREQVEEFLKQYPIKVFKILMEVPEWKEFWETKDDR